MRSDSCPSSFATPYIPCRLVLDLRMPSDMPYNAATLSSVLTPCSYFNTQSYFMYDIGKSSMPLASIFPHFFKWGIWAGVHSPWFVIYIPFCFVMTSSGFGCYVFLGAMLLPSHPMLCYARVMSEMGYEFGKQFNMYIVCDTRGTLRWGAVQCHPHCPRPRRPPR
jgi:hypothetical protein